MKPLTTIVALLLCLQTAFAQQQIIQGQRLPRLTTAQRDQIETTNNVLASGQVIFNTDINCLEYWNSKKWVSLCLGTADITLTGDCKLGDLFASDGSTVCTFTPDENPKCTENPPYSILLITGDAYAMLQITDELTAEFSISFSENNRSTPRNAIVRVTNNCTNEFKEFVFTQEGATCPTTTEFAVKTSSDPAVLCAGNGAVIAWIDGADADIDYVWATGGMIVHTGTLMQITRAGTYTVYAGLLGCDEAPAKAQTFTVTPNTGDNSPTVPVIQATNGGVLCSGGTVILTANNVATGSNVLWFLNDTLHQTTSTHTLSLTADPSLAGTWFAVQQDGNTCGSRMSNTLTLFDKTGGSPALAMPDAKVNGESLTGNPVVCKGGTLRLEVWNVYPSGTVYEWFDNGVNIYRGTESVVYTVAPSANSMVLSVQVSNNLGGCPSTAVSSPISVTFTAPVSTSINNGATTAAICGSSPAILMANNASGFSYEWFVNGVKIDLNANTASYPAAVAGNYTVRYSDNNNCWSPVSIPISVVHSAAITLNWQTTPGSTGIIGTQSTLTVLSSPAADDYTWSSSDTDVATVMKITPGNTAVVDYLKADGGTPITITVEATNACGAVSLSAPINVSTGCPTITTATITPTGTITRFIDISGKPKTSGDSITSFRASAPNMTNPSDVTYAWTVNGVQQASPVTPTFTYVTPNVGGLYPVYAVASTTCEPVTSATTPTVNVRVIKDTPLDTSGTYRLNGKICYDVNRTDGTFANGCMPMSARKDDFASTKTFNYTFVSTAAFSDLFCYVIDPNDLIVSSSLNGNIFTVTFRNDINSVVTGRDKSSAFRLTLVAQYIDAKSNAQQVTLGVSVQDCFCCGSGGTAVPQTIGNNEYLTHLYMTGSVERCWMVENSREGTPTRTTYPKKAAGERGFYYTWGAVAQTACPAGWRVPSLKESEDLTFTLRAMVNNNNADNPRRFWSQEEHLAGVVSSGGSGNSWGEYGYWWTSVYLKSMHSYVKTTIGPYVVQIAETGWSFPIRCVQDN